MKHPIVFCLGVALSLSVVACHKHSSDSSAPAASAAVATIPADSAAADPTPAPPDSAAVPTEQDYEEQAAQTVSTSQSLDSQVNAIAKEIGTPSK